MDLRPLINRLVCDSAARRAPDRATIEKLVAGFETELEARAIKPSPFVVLRIHDVITQYRIARRLERCVFDEGVVTAPETAPKNGHTSNGTKPNGRAKTVAAVHPAVEASAKAWERVRNALHDLEAVCGTAAAGHALSLADAVAPLLEQGEGVLEEAIAVENARQREMDALAQRNRELSAKITATQ
jgi:hypothetical protein